MEKITVFPKALFSPAYFLGMSVIDLDCTTTGGECNNARCFTSLARPLLHVQTNT